MVIHHSLSFVKPWLVQTMASLATNALQFTILLVHSSLKAVFPAPTIPVPASSSQLSLPKSSELPITTIASSLTLLVHYHDVWLLIRTIVDPQSTGKD